MAAIWVRMPSHKLAIGAIGEEHAAEYLRKLGYRIVHRNYRTSSGEIDIVAHHAGTLVFVEVKARSSTRFGPGYLAVNAAKRQKLRSQALLYVQNEQQQYAPIRFDVVSILTTPTGTLVDLRHFIGAF